MPGRLLREGILDSAAVNALSFPAEVFYRRLMSVVDDYGRFDARPAVLRGRLYALKLDTVLESDIAGWVGECERAGLIALYTVSAKPYLLFKNLGQPRAKESKFPPPPAQAETSASQNASASGCVQTQADARIRTQTHTDAPYSYSTPTSYSTTNSGAGTDSGSTREPPAEPRPVGPSTPAAVPDPEPFDPLRHEEAGRKLFEARWRGAGLRPFARLDKSLWGLLASLLADSWWAENYPAAIERAGQIPFLRDGANRNKGKLDVSEFIRDSDMVRKVLEGNYDPKNPTQRAPPGSLTERAAGNFAEFLNRGADGPPAEAA